MIETYFNEIIQELLINRIISSFKILKRIVSEEDGYIRIRCVLSSSDILEFAEYIQIVKSKPHIETYSFHWQSASGKLIKRWDNVKHHKNIDTYPYHLHMPNGTVFDSNPINLKKVLVKIEKELQDSQG